MVSGARGFFLDFNCYGAFMQQVQDRFAIGLDIGGTKIAGAIFDQHGRECAQKVTPTPDNYPAFIAATVATVQGLESQISVKNATLGIGAPYGLANMPFIMGKPMEQDIAAALGRSVVVGNDANCAALAEAKDGAGQGYASVFGLIIGTGVAGGYVIDGKIRSGANGLMGEIGHLPLPYYADADGELVPCGCGQKGCLEKLICAAGLSRLYARMTGRDAQPVAIADAARAGDAEALGVLDHYYTVVAKAMITVIHSFDPDIITVSGGLSTLPGLYTAVPERWGRYAIGKTLTTKFVPAQHGPMAGLRGAAWLGRS